MASLDTSLGYPVISQEVTTGRGKERQGRGQ